MPDPRRPLARWWYDLPELADMAAGPALSDALLAEEATHGVTREVAWAYAAAIPTLLGSDAKLDVRPLAFRRGALRAVALSQPLALAGLYHVQTSSPEVCREMGARVPSFSVRGEACVEALLRHGSAVREVIASDCVPFAADAPFRLSFASTQQLPPRWFNVYLAEPFMPIVRLDLSVWLCWDRDLERPCVVEGHDTIVEGRWDPRDVAPEVEPPPWAEPDAETIGGERWAATMLHNHRRSGASTLAEPGRGWCRLQTDGDASHHDALRAAWRAGESLQAVNGSRGDFSTLAELRFAGATARFAWLGHERVLRLRGGQLAQLTMDHDLHHAALHGDAGMTPELLAQLGDDIPDVVVRGLPAHAPEAGSCPVEAGDRFVLIARGTQEDLEREAGDRAAFVRRLGDGAASDVARWMRDALLHAEREQPVVIVDADATIEPRRPRPRVVASPPPTIRDLVERPAEFHGRQIRVRGQYRSMMEVSEFAGAWFRGESSLRWGIHIVEAEGLWLHDGSGRGHFGLYASELRGTLIPVDLSRPRPISPERIRFARPYVPLSAQIVVQRGLLGWTHDGREMLRLGPNGRLPPTETPERCRVQATFCVDSWGRLGVVAWEILDAEPLAPERTTAAAPGWRGRFVEIEGLLAPTNTFPRLDGVLAVSPPSLTLSDGRHTVPQADAVARYRDILGAGRRVRVRGEVSHSSLLALTITDESGSLEL